MRSAGETSQYHHHSSSASGTSSSEEDQLLHPAAQPLLADPQAVAGSLQDTAENEIYDSDESNLLRTPLDRGPYFDLSASKNITALVGKTAYLNCRVKNLGNKTVSSSFFFFSGELTL